MTPESLETWILLLLGPPALAVLAVMVGVAILTVYAGLRGRGDPKDALQALHFEAARRPRLVQRVVWLGIEGGLQVLSFVLQGLHLLRLRPPLHIRPGEGGTPVILVAGYLENSGQMYVLGRRLGTAGFRVVHADLPSTLRSVRDNAAHLRQVVGEVLRETGAERVAIVAHSMGGVIARALVHAEPAPPVAVVVSIASPHRGTHVARLGLGASARDMTPGSDHLLAHPPDRRGPVPVHCVVAPQENIVSPAWSALLDEGENLVLDVPAGHVGPLFLPAVTRRVVGWLEAAGVERAAPGRALEARTT